VDSAWIAPLAITWCDAQQDGARKLAQKQIKSRKILPCSLAPARCARAAAACARACQHSRHSAQAGGWCETA